MATLNELKRDLRQAVIKMGSPSTQPLSDPQYSAGFNVLLQGAEDSVYQNFIVPQLSLLLAPCLKYRVGVSMLEIGPGPESVLGHLPGYMRRKVKKYAAYEPNALFATRLEEWLRKTSDTGVPLPFLDSPANIHRFPFGLGSTTDSDANSSSGNDADMFDIILFCHSMYGMNPKHRFIERALEMLVKQPGEGIIIVFHRAESLDFGRLICHRSASFPTGVVRVADNDDVLDRFALFVAGLSITDPEAKRATQVEWRKACRALGSREDSHPGQISFSSPSIMVAFNQHATGLAASTTAVLPDSGTRDVKNKEARLHHPASVIRPTQIQHVQECVRWAVQNQVGLTVIGGGHSGHCLWPHVIAIDLGAFDQVHILSAREGGVSSLNYPLVIAEAGCKSGDVISRTMAAELTVPLGARPSVGAGLWLQGGIGHLARLHGLTCDAVVGAVVVSVASGEALYVGRVPRQHIPVGAVRPENEQELLWALRGAGTNFGIVMSVTFRAYTAPTYSIRNWVIPLSNNVETQSRLGDLDNFIARDFPRNCSLDAYLYCDADQLLLGVTVIETSTSRPGLGMSEPGPGPMSAAAVLGPEDSLKTVDGVGLFGTEMYMSGMHGGHGGGKTSSFKRCVLLRHIGAVNVANILVAAVDSRPSPLCYFHLLQGGGAVGDVVSNATAFGCRDWTFACVVTGVWPRDQEGTQIARTAVQWVYNVTSNLLPFCRGVYGADLGPDPRDGPLAAKAFDFNRWRLARVKRDLDPGNVLAYACPLPRAPSIPKLIVLVTGKSGAGKDHCANLWVSLLNTKYYLRARAASISDVTKREYAAATFADLDRLMSDRTYKEHHRPALTAFFERQVQQRPRLLEDHFLDLVYDAMDIDILLITGMRDEAPVTALSYLVPNVRLLELRIEANRETRQARRGYQSVDDDEHPEDASSQAAAVGHCPNLVFNNDTVENEVAHRFAEKYLLPFFHDDLQRLADMVRPVVDFPRAGIDFCHVLDISQKPYGLSLCTSLLHAHFTGDWARVDVMVTCEAGGFVFGSALAARVGVGLALIREAAKLPPPVASIIKSPSHISSLASKHTKEHKIEINLDVIPKDASVVVVDDVLATGRTLCAVLHLLNKIGVMSEKISVMTVAEFPIHRGRELLRQHGFGTVNVQSLLIFGSA